MFLAYNEKVANVVKKKKKNENFHSSLNYQVLLFETSFSKLISSNELTCNYSEYCPGTSECLSGMYAAIFEQSAIPSLFQYSSWPFFMLCVNIFFTKKLHYPYLAPFNFLTSNIEKKGGDIGLWWDEEHN